MRECSVGITPDSPAAAGEASAADGHARFRACPFRRAGFASRGTAMARDVSATRSRLYPRPKKSWVALLAEPGQRSQASALCRSACAHWRSTRLRWRWTVARSRCRLASSRASRPASRRPKRRLPRRWLSSSPGSRSCRNSAITVALSAPCRSTSSAAAGTTGPRGSETGLRSRIRPAVTGEDTRVGLPDLNFDETRLRLESLIRT